MTTHLQRADQGIENLQSIINRLNEEAGRVNDPAKRADIGENVGAGTVPEEFATECRAIVQAFLSALEIEDRPVYGRPPRKPPKRWRDFQAFVANERLKDSTSYPALIHAFDILDRHVREEDTRLGWLALLTQDIERKIKYTHTDARPSPGIYPKGINFIFDLQINNEVDKTFRELINEVPIFPIQCVAFFKIVLDEIRAVYKHFELPEA